MAWVCVERDAVEPKTYAEAEDNTRAADTNDIPTRRVNIVGWAQVILAIQSA